MIAVHGLESTKQEAVHIGGLDKRLRVAINQSLGDAGFEAKVVKVGAHAAVSPNNICNQGRSGAGVQLELTRALRDVLVNSPEKMNAFAKSIQSSIANTLGLRP